MDIPRGGSSCPLFPGRTGIWNVSFCDGRETGAEDPEKNSRSKDENQPQTQPNFQVELEFGMLVFVKGGGGGSWTVWRHI